MPARTLSLSFPGAGGSMLAARLDLPPQGAPLAYALFAHCFTCSKQGHAYVSARWPARYRSAAFRFHRLGGAAGFRQHHFFECGGSRFCRGLPAAALRAPSMVGHSLGGSAILAAAPSAEAVAVATIGSPLTRSCAAPHQGQGGGRAHGEAEVDIGGRPFGYAGGSGGHLGQQLGDNVARMRKALLVMHSPRDTVIGIDNATQIFSAAKHPSFISLIRPTICCRRGTRSTPAAFSRLGGALPRRRHRSAPRL